MNTADGNNLGALFYYTNVVYSVSVIRSDADLADITGRLKLMCSGERHIKSVMFSELWYSNNAREFSNLIDNILRFNLHLLGSLQPSEMAFVKPLLRSFSSLMNML